MSIIPIVCFTCGKPVANLWNKYLEEVSKQEEKNGDDGGDGGDGDDGENLINEDKSKILDNLNIKRYCCRRMFLTNVDLCDKI
jgi:DNA-directed RNA polymerase subunit N (RpoN/RPB10)